MNTLLLLLLLAAPTRDADRVLVVRNAASPVSCRVAADYARRRGVRNMVSVRAPDSAVSTANETIAYPEYRVGIEERLRAYLRRHPAIDYLVMTKGVPIRIDGAPGFGAGGTRPSVDSTLAALGYDATPGSVRVAMSDSGFTGTAWANRFWGSSQPFSHRRTGGYLVTRLDGYTEHDAMALVARSLAAERAAPRGAVLLDTCPAFGYAKDGPPKPLWTREPKGGTAVSVGELAFDAYNGDMRRAAARLRAAKAPVVLDETDAFVSGAGLMGYVSWGSNDRHFDAGAYRDLRFAPGAVCETAVSTSARTFLPTTGGQSLIADLVAQGVTGAKGYTDEPLLQAVACTSILLDRYTRGWNLADAYYAASRFVGWEDIVIGDPLCHPYRNKGAGAGVGHVDVRGTRPHRRR